MIHQEGIFSKFSHLSIETTDVMVGRIFLPVRGRARLISYPCIKQWIVKLIFISGSNPTKFIKGKLMINSKGAECKRTNFFLLIIFKQLVLTGILLRSLLCFMKWQIPTKATNLCSLLIFQSIEYISHNYGRWVYRGFVRVAIDRPYKYSTNI